MSLKDQPFMISEFRKENKIVTNSSWIGCWRYKTYPMENWNILTRSYRIATSTQIVDILQHVIGPNEIKLSTLNKVLNLKFEFFGWLSRYLSM